MNINKLFMLMLLAASMGLVVSCDSDNSSNAQDMVGVEEVSCPCNFDQDFWTELGWMVAQGGDAFDKCLTKNSGNETLLSLQGLHTINADGGVLSLECEAAITTDTTTGMFPAQICDGQIVCTATDMNETKDIMKFLYLEQKNINDDQLTACQNDIEDIATVLGISCGN